MPPLAIAARIAAHSRKMAPRLDHRWRGVSSKRCSRRLLGKAKTSRSAQQLTRVRTAIERT
jgi:hypothetical protein